MCKISLVFLGASTFIWGLGYGGPLACQNTLAMKAVGFEERSEPVSPPS